MNSSGSLRWILPVIAVLSLLPFLPVRGQIFDTNYDENTSSWDIDDYALNGSPVSVPLVGGLQPTFYMAASGNDLFISAGGDSVGEYSTAGATINSSLVSGLPNVAGVAVSGSDLYVVIPGNSSGFSGSIAKYSISGTPENTSLITGLGDPSAIAVSGSDLFVVENYSGVISEYTTSGVLVKQDLITGLDGNSHGLVVIGSDLYVASFGPFGTSNGTIGEYTTDGQTINASLVSDMNGPYGLATNGSDLFVANAANGTIGEYDLNGNAVNPSLVSGLSNVDGIVVVPEPRPLALFFSGMALLVVVWPWKHFFRARCFGQR
jgi:hypothetical protein